MSFLSKIGSAVGGFLGDWGDAISLVGTGVSAYQTWKSGDAAYDMAQYNKELEAFNTEEQLRIHRERVKRTVAAQRSSAAGAGVRSGTGSPLLLRLDTIHQGAVDEFYIRRGGELREAARVYSGQVARSTARTGAVNNAFQGLADYAKVYGR